MNPFTSITMLSGIGEKKAKILKKLNIDSIYDLVHYFPRDYEENKALSKISDIKPNNVYLIEGYVCQEPQNIRIKNLILTKMKVKDDSGEISVTWYKQPYLKNKFSLEQKVYLKGIVKLKYGVLQIQSPKILKSDDPILLGNQQFIPIYPLTGNLSNKQITDFIKLGLSYIGGKLKDPLPMDIKLMYNLCEYNYALDQIHNPESLESLEASKKRLIFDEFLMFQLGLLMLKNECYVMDNQYKFLVEKKVKELIASLPFKLTNAQIKVWEEIKSDLTGNKTMNRLIQGDVGSGKTILAILSLVFATENGYQGAMMAPTEVLAKQHYTALTKLLKPFDIKICLLVGSMTKKQKEEAAFLVESGEFQIVIGTHAIIQENVVFNNLALVITDEQHRFGVKQREKLAGKGYYPHVLVMSATPIPRTLALIVYGDMDVSIVNELPPGRQEIKTYNVTSKYRERIYRFLEKEIENGRQAYIICPMVEENEELDLENVISYTKKLKEQLKSSINIAYLHGKMKPKEKNNIMEEFAEGKVDILVSTTVVEVGVNVVNATIIVIENAERFGLAGLHQLRGRVGRGQYQSYCILITDSESEITKKRMSVLEKYTDGFIISEYDLKLRGPGDAFGIKQHGLPEFKIGNIFENIDILKTTNELAKEIINEDKALEREKYRSLYMRLKQGLEQEIQNINL